MRRAGFTLLELMLASVLTTVLLLGVMAVIVRLASVSNAPGVDHAALEPEALALLLREDLRNTDKVEANDAGLLVLRGLCGLDAQRRERVHQPVRVSYSVESLDGRSWVVRRQEWLESRSNRNVQRDLVAAGVQSFEITSELGQPPAATRPRSDTADPFQQTAAVRPRLWRVRWRTEAQPQVLREMPLLVTWTEAG